MKSFAEFITSRRMTDTPRGNFIRATKTLIKCGRFPDIKRWLDLYRFMQQRGSCPGEFEEARRMWRQYRKLNSLEIVS